MQKRITKNIKFKKPKLNIINKINKIAKINIIKSVFSDFSKKNENINTLNFNLNKYSSFSSTNKAYNKSNSYFSITSKANTNTNNQNNFNKSKQKLNRCFGVDMNDKILFRMRAKKRNLNKNSSYFTDNISKDGNLYFPSFHKYKRSNSNEQLLRRINKLNFENNSNDFLIKKILKKSYSKPNISNNILKNNETLNILSNIEKHRKNKIDKEIKSIIKETTKEIKIKNKRLIYAYSQNNIMIPYRLMAKTNFHSSKSTLNEIDLHKLNIMTKSKVLDINDIQKQNISKFFNFEKVENNKRNSSLENLNLIINNNSIKYISDYYTNNSLVKPGIKVTKYKSKKLHEIYNSLKE